MKPLAAVLNNGGIFIKVSTLFTTVGFPQSPRLGRKWRLIAGFSSQAFDGIDQSRLLAAYIGAGPFAQFNIHILQESLFSSPEIWH